MLANLQESAFDVWLFHYFFLTSPLVPFIPLHRRAQMVKEQFAFIFKDSSFLIKCYLLKASESRTNGCVALDQTLDWWMSAWEWGNQKGFLLVTLTRTHDFWHKWVGTTNTEKVFRRCHLGLFWLCLERVSDPTDTGTAASWKPQVARCSWLNSCKSWFL